ncbi:unnamed protein product [Candidula unifasciata]|uniref:FAM20 C-terminal domain-containing protein n=1 Tax=Candidula unifasciata TaxID=100452 RepID=A0A8S3YNH5_9EUPU|nr:unnamed protein product [Candidula unifasciata]
MSLHILLELMDLAAFDFLAGNLDRHAYQRFTDLGEESFVILFDSGRAFSQPSHDHMSALAPLRQCCRIRLSTLAKFIKLYKGPDSLGMVMRSSLNSDPLSPILTDVYFEALDRRVEKVIKTISDCLVNATSWDAVVFDDLSS